MSDVDIIVCARGFCNADLIGIAQGTTSLLGKKGCSFTSANETSRELEGLEALFRFRDLNEAAGAADATRGLNQEDKHQPVKL